MFENIADVMKRNIVAPKTPLFACTVGQKPSYYQVFKVSVKDV